MVKIPSRIRIFLASGVACLCVAPVALAQTPSANEAAYHTLLQQIADQKISIAQKQVFIARQGDQMKALKAQLDGMDDLKASVKPMLAKMVAGIEREFKADYPFEQDAREFRIESLKTLAADENASVGSIYRKALSVYQIEVNYGQGLDAFKGNNPIPERRVARNTDDELYEKEDDGKFKLDKNLQRVEIYDGNYLRYGRTAFVYMNNDGGDAQRYDLETRAWVALKGNTAAIRRAIRVSKGEVAPGVVVAPVLPMP